MKKIGFVNFYTFLPNPSKYAFSSVSGFRDTETVLSCCAIIGFQQTKVRYLGNSVPEMSTTKGITNQFSFVYTIVKSRLFIIYEAFGYLMSVIVTPGNYVNNDLSNC